MGLTAVEREELMRDVPTLEEFWASFNKSKANWERELAESQANWERQSAESRKNWERELAESRENWKQQLAESQANWEQQLAKSQAVSEREFARLSRLQDKNEKIIGDLGNSIGGLIETLIAGRVWEKFKDTPYRHVRQTSRRVQIIEGKRVLTEVDILLFNSDTCMAVEVKREPSIKNVDYHVKRMDLIKKYPPVGTEGKRLAGAIAGGFVAAEVRDYAHQQGFFVLELNGENVSLAEMPDGFKAREW